MIMRNFVLAGLLSAALAVPVLAQDDAFVDAPNGAKQHIASTFVCPAQIGRFERDAVGVRDPEREADFCAYSARDGVYGTVTILPLHGEFNPEALLAPDFVVQEGTGGRRSSEGVQNLGPQKNLPVYQRIYDAAKIETMRYRVQFACAVLGGWAIEVTVEYADPRDSGFKDDFVNAVYGAAQAKLAAPPAIPARP
jgi:hypothetical protein